MTNPEFPTILHCADLVQYFVAKNSLIQLGFMEVHSTVVLSRQSNYLKLDQLGSVKMFALCSKSEYDKFNNESDENDL